MSDADRILSRLVVEALARHKPVPVPQVLDVAQRLDAMAEQVWPADAERDENVADRDAEEAENVADAYRTAAEMIRALTDPAIDTSSVASRQHFIETGRYLRTGEEI